MWEETNTNRNTNNNQETTQNIEQTSSSTIGSWYTTFINNPFVQFIWNLGFTLVIFIILAVLSSIISKIIKRRIINNSIVWDEQYNAKFWSLIWDIVFYILILFSLVIALDMLWADLWLLLWWLAVWIWFAIKEVLWNMIAGVMILTTKELKINDIIEIDYNSWYFWRIVSINMRYSVLKTLENRKVVVPNLVMVTSPIKTFTAEWVIRLEINVKVHLDTDLDKAIDLIRNTINSIELVKEKDTTFVVVDNMLEDWVVLRAMFYYDPNAWLLASRMKSEIYKLIHKRLKENNIIIPYPHTSITIDKNDKNFLSNILYLFKSFKNIDNSWNN